MGNGFNTGLQNIVAGAQLYSEREAKKAETARQRAFAQEMQKNQQGFQAEQRRLDRDLQRELQSIALMGRGQTETPFQAALTKKSAESFQKEEDAANAASKTIDKVDDAIKSILDFESNSIAGTGPIAQYTTSNPLFNKDAELLDRKFKSLSLDTMKDMFAGMSKAIDSDAERKFYQQSQASMGNRPETNIEILLGAKSIALKKQAEVAAKKAWLSQNKDLKKYRSPIINKSTAMMDPNGQMMLVEKDQVGALQQKGFQTIDDFAKNQLGRGGSSRTAQVSPAAQMGPSGAQASPDVQNARLQDFMSRATPEQLRQLGIK